jgi:hypothetical protein
VSLGVRCRRLPSAAFLFLSVGLFLSCSPPAGEAASRAEAKAEALFVALEEADLEALEGLGPVFEGLESEEIERLREQLVSRYEWEVGEAEVSGRRAVVPVTLSPRAIDDPEETPPRTEERILVPMRWRSGSWRIEGSLTVTQQIDLVPLAD